MPDHRYPNHARAERCAKPPSPPKPMPRGRKSRVSVPQPKRRHSTPLRHGPTAPRLKPGKKNSKIVKTARSDRPEKRKRAGNHFRRRVHVRDTQGISASLTAVHSPISPFSPTRSADRVLRRLPFNYSRIIPHAAISGVLGDVPPADPSRLLPNWCPFSTRAPAAKIPRRVSPDSRRRGHDERSSGLAPLSPMQSSHRVNRSWIRNQPLSMFLAVDKTPKQLFPLQQFPHEEVAKAEHLFAKPIQDRKIPLLVRRPRPPRLSALFCKTPPRPALPPKSRP